MASQTAAREQRRATAFGLSALDAVQEVAMGGFCWRSRWRRSPEPWPSCAATVGRAGNRTRSPPPEVAQEHRSGAEPPHRRLCIIAPPARCRAGTPDPERDRGRGNSAAPAAGGPSPVVHFRRTPRPVSAACRTDTVPARATASGLRCARRNAPLLSCRASPAGPSGGVAERLKAHAWRACMGATPSRVRIPLPPPL